VLLAFYGSVMLFQAVPVTYHVHVNDLSPEYKLFDLLQVQLFRLADSNDTIKVHINSHGGYVSHGLLWINRIAETEAHTIATRIK
jgi:ATP-dependent protease ClpP protease subunit